MCWSGRKKVGTFKNSFIIKALTRTVSETTKVGNKCMVSKQSEFENTPRVDIRRKKLCPYGRCPWYADSIQYFVTKKDTQNKKLIRFLLFG